MESKPAIAGRRLKIKFKKLFPLERVAIGF